MWELARWVEQPWLAAACAFALLAAWHRWEALPAVARRAWVASAAVVVASFGVRSVGIARHRLAIGAEWDFLGFWAPGRAAWLGVDFYAPAVLRALDLPWEPSRFWAAELLVAGSVYPPFTSFLFAPFGAFDYATAYWLWCGANALALAGAVVWAGRRFFAEHPHGWLAAACTVALLRATLYTVPMQQSTPSPAPPSRSASS